MTETIAAETRVALSRELSEFLVELSIGVHRHAMYPPVHPSLKPVVENIVGRLTEIFKHRRTLSIGVAQRQLVIEGIATDQRHPVLSDLSRRLHEHQLGALSFDAGVTTSEVSEILAALALETERGGAPLGQLSADDMPAWEHAYVYRVGYDRLQIRDGDGGGGPHPGAAHVCDVFDALRTHRPYREAWPTARALKIIEEGAGPEFDKDMAHAFITMMGRWEGRVAEATLDQPDIVDPSAAPPGVGGSTPEGA